jgi:hypothetical protein
MAWQRVVVLACNEIGQKAFNGKKQGGVVYGNIIGWHFAAAFNLPGDRLRRRQIGHFAFPFFFIYKEEQNRSNDKEE